MPGGARDGSSGRIFTEYVRALEPDGEPPQEPELQRLWAALRAAVRGELRKRGLWASPPSYLGVFGWESWSAPGPAGPTGEEDALEELVLECYSFIFVRRLRGLKAQLMVKPNIDGLVFLNIRNFLYERQRAFDPLGFRVFEIVQAAALAAVADGVLHVLEGPSSVRNESVLGFSLGIRAGDLRARVPTLEAAAKRWNDALLPELVTARGRGQEEVILRLCTLLQELGPARMEAFLFKDLVDALKNDVRRRWQDLFQRSLGEHAVGGELGALVKSVRPDPSFEEQHDFEKLCNCVAQLVEGVEEDERTRCYLSTLWQFLRASAAEAGELRLSGLRAETELGIPRRRLGALESLLGSLVLECRGKLAGAALAARRAVRTPREEGPGRVAR